jgi:polyphosphate kinase 2 (PPK2 family)
MNEEAINKTATEKCSWFIVPADDDKDIRRYIVGEIIWEEMQKYTDIKNLS